MLRAHRTATLITIQHTVPPPTSPRFSDLSTAKQLWSMVVWHLLDEDVSSGYLRIGSFRDAGIGWAYHFARIVFTF